MNRFFRTLPWRPYALILVSCLIGVRQAPAVTEPTSSVASVSGAAFGLESPTAKLGLVKKGDRAQASFVVRNSGSAPLTLTLEAASCECMKVELPAAIAAGAEGTVAVRIETGSLDGAEELSLTLRTNDPRRPVEQLSVQIVVEPWLESFPGYARYVYVQHEVPGPITQTLWSVDSANFRVLGVQSPYGFLSVEFREALAAERRAGIEGAQWVVVSTIQPTAEVGALRGDIVVRTNHPKQAEVRIPLSGFVRPVVAVTPEVADFGKVPVNLEKSYRAVVTVAIYSTELIPMTLLQVVGEGIEARLRPVTEGRRYQLDILVRADKEGAVHGTVVLTSDSPKAPRIEIPVVLQAVKAAS